MSELQTFWVVAVITAVLFVLAEISHGPPPTSGGDIPLEDAFA